VSRGRGKDAAALARADLARSGLHGDLGKMSVRALERAEAKAHDPKCSWWRHAPDGLASELFEYRTHEGKKDGFWRMRATEDPPPCGFSGVVPKLRYHQAKGSEPRAWFSTAVRWPEALAGVAKGEATLVICEGEKKAEAICRAGGGKVVAIGLGGVSNVASKARRIEVISDLLLVAKLARGSSPIVCFDADGKPSARRNVSAAAIRVGELLRSQGLSPLVARLPLLDGQEKTGPDDFIVAKGWKALVKVLDAAEELFPKEELTDVGNGVRLARRALGRFVYVVEWKRWMRYDGQRWIEDGRGIYQLAVETTKDIFLEAAALGAEAENAPDKEAQALRDKSKKIHAHALASQKIERREAMVKSAPDAWPDLVATPKEFDSDPWLLNVENGTIDLRTGELRPHEPADLITKLAPVAYDPSARAPEFARDHIPAGQTDRSPRG